MMANGRSI